MSDTAPEPKPGGIFLPAPIIVTIALAVAALIVGYVFATKAELVSHAMAESTRVTVVEETVKYQGATIEDLQDTVKAVDQNLRTLMLEQGVADKKIIKPEEGKKP